MKRVRRRARENPNQVNYWLGFGCVAAGLVALAALTRMSDKDRKATIGV